ncbi:MAG TPA: VOC family protein [Mycobacteriales bacterium]|jgi:catechol 2,3-dioxygenase-like lactoylglutathione lyase family enzyme|nr:VOC family protein [Mycobacteriales bacterium]
MRWSGINHLAMVTPDMDATVRFYAAVLGMELVGTLGNGDPNEPYPYRHYFFRTGERTTIAFFEWPGVDTGANVPAGVPKAGQKFDHLSFDVPTVEDLLALRERLAEHGIEVTPVIDHTVFYSVYFDDPVNGAALEASVWVRDLDRVPYWGDPDPVPSALRHVKERDAQARPPGKPDF